MTETVNKQDLMQQIEQSYAELEAALAALDAAQMTAPALPGGWSVKDALAHLSVWHRRALDVIQPVQPPRVPEIPPSGIEEDQVETFNARFYSEHKDEPLAEVLAGFRDSYHQLLAGVQRLTEADLTQPLLGNTQTWHIIAGNTYDHYPEHLETIRAVFPTA
jgi:uncharacterized protein (TIGR03083 family)